MRAIVRHTYVVTTFANESRCGVYFTGHTMVGNLQVCLEVSLTAVWRTVQVGAGHADLAAATPRASTVSQRLHVGNAVRPIVGALDTAPWTATSAVHCPVDHDHRFGRTGGVEVVPLTDLVQRPLYSHIDTHTCRFTVQLDYAQSARMSKITNDGLTRSGTECFI